MSKEAAKLVQGVIDSIRGRLPDGTAEVAQDLLDHNEWGESLVVICTQLYEYDVAVPVEIINSIRVAGTEMQLDPKIWSRLSVEG